jgi:hypothetical protein
MGSACQDRGVTALRKPDRQTLIRASVAVVGIVAAGFVLWVIAGFAGSSSTGTAGYQTVNAKVTSSASCAAANANDAVSFTLSGQKHTGLLSGCGNAVGTAVDILVPGDFADGGTVNLASAAPGDASGLSRRVSFLMLLVSAAVGGASAYYFARHPVVAARSRALPLDEELHEPKLETFGGEPLNELSMSQDLPPLDMTQAHDSADWFEDSSTDLHADAGDPADRQR